MNIPTINMSKTGQNIKALRKKANLSVEELAERLGFNTPQAVYKWQNGTNLPRVDNLFALGEIFGVGINEIIVLDGKE